MTEPRRRLVDPRMASRLLALVLLGCVSLLAVPATAHTGHRPILEVERSGSGLRIGWITNSYEFTSIRTLLQIVFANPLVIEDDPRFVEYVTSRLNVVAHQRSCTKQVTGVRTVATGYRTDVAVTCDGAVSAATIESQLLLDVSGEYEHDVRIQSPSGVLEAALTAAAPAVSVDLIAGELISSDLVAGRARFLGLSAVAGSLVLLVGLGTASLLLTLRIRARRARTRRLTARARGGRRRTRPSGR